MCVAFRVISGTRPGRTDIAYSFGLWRDHFLNSVLCAAAYVPASVANVFAKALAAAQDAAVLDVAAEALSCLACFLAALLHLPLGGWLALRVLLRKRGRGSQRQDNYHCRCEYHLRYRLHVHYLQSNKSFRNRYMTSRDDPPAKFHTSTALATKLKSMAADQLIRSGELEGLGAA